MLESLSIRNILLIPSLDIEWGEGLSVLTGETGAGKSILLEALGLILGGRSESGLIREGQQTASVAGVFCGVNPIVFEFLGKSGVILDQGQLVIRRVLDRERGSRAFLNDIPVTLPLLRTVSSFLLDIHGQFDSLSGASAYRQALGAFLGEDKKQELTVALAYKEFVEAKQELESFSLLQKEGSLQAPFWRQSLEEIKRLGLKSGEVAFLEQQRSQMGHQDKILHNLHAMEALLREKLLPALNEMEKLFRRLEEWGDAWGALGKRISATYVDLEDMHQTLQKDSQKQEEGALSLEAIESRLFEIRAICRKYHSTQEDLPILLDQLSEKLEAVESGEERYATLLKKVEVKKKEYCEAAEILSQARKRAAREIESHVQRELPALKLPEAKFSIRFAALVEEKWTSHGIDEVSFYIQTNPGSKAGLIHEIASGGERSRLSLGLKLALAKAYPQMTFVFDEVDSGIGGATAFAVGERLARLAREPGNQVLVVTHSPQVASFGREHWFISKKLEGEMTRTDACRLTDEERREEISRMLSGSTITQESRNAGLQMMERAREVFSCEG